jgi:hypothetical protein
MSNDLAHFRAADAEHELGEAKQRAAYLVQVMDPATRRALAREPIVLGWLERVDAAWVFVTGPEDARNHARAVTQALLGAVGTLAGSLGGSKAGTASGAAKQADLEPRNQKVREQWEAAPAYPTLIARGRHVVEALKAAGWKRDEIPKPRAVVRIATQKINPTMNR